MTQIQDRYRRWLDAHTPSDAEAHADLNATLAAVHRPRGRSWRVPAAVAAVAVVVTLVLGRRTPEPPPPVAWGVRFDLHVAGQSPDTDVRIRIAVREDTP